MDFDQMLETWKSQDEAPPYDVNRDALRQALQSEEAKIRRELRIRRRGLLFSWIFGIGMAIWAGFWIAITITNGWPAIYAIASGLSVGMFALAAWALWTSRGRAPKRNFGNTLQEEVRRNLALVDCQLSLARRWMLLMVGMVSLMIGTGLFSWTVNRSQDIPNLSSGVGWFWFTVLFVAFVVWASLKERNDMRNAKPKLELRQQHLRELLETLDAGE